MSIVKDEYGTVLDKITMIEEIVHKIAEQNPEAFNWHPKENSPEFITKRTIHSHITLGDVLHTLMRMGCYFTFTHNFRLSVRGKDGRDLNGIEWDCSKDKLDMQEETTVKYLFDVIVVQPKKTLLCAMSNTYRNPYFPPPKNEILPSPLA